MTIDIHDYEVAYTRAVAAVERSNISQRNKDLIFGYRDACLVQQLCGKVRLIRAMGALALFASILQKDFDTITKTDVQQLLSKLLAHDPPYSAATLATYRAILKRFCTWQAHPDAFSQHATPPEHVAWITVHLRKRDQRPLERNALLTPQDIEDVLRVTRNTRDRALISVLWETGGRIAEVGNLQLRHVTKAAHGFTLDLNGKTGHRNPIIVSSAPALAAWLADHPFPHDPDAPLWAHRVSTPHPRHLTYASIARLLQRTFARAGVTKRVHPHLFRHSRVTYVLANGLMNESQAKAYFGWTPDSDMLATYAHLVDSDANNAILRENNLAPQKQVSVMQPRTCQICEEINQPTAEYCVKCGAVLDLKRAYEHQQLHDAKEQLFTSMFKLLVEKGLVDEAARQVHDANLGHVLKQLAHTIDSATRGGTK